MKAVLTVALLMMTAAAAQAKPMEITCVDWSFSPVNQIKIWQFTQNESEHIGHQIGFEIQARSEAGKLEVIASGVAVEASSSTPEIQVFDLFKGWPYKTAPSNADGQAIVVLDPVTAGTDPVLIWNGVNIPLMKCTNK